MLGQLITHTQPNPAKARLQASLEIVSAPDRVMIYVPVDTQSSFDFLPSALSPSMPRFFAHEQMGS